MGEGLAAAAMNLGNGKCIFLKTSFSVLLSALVLFFSCSVNMFQFNGSHFTVMRKCASACGSSSCTEGFTVCIKTHSWETLGLDKLLLTVFFT